MDQVNSGALLEHSLIKKRVSVVSPIALNLCRRQSIAIHLDM